MTTNFITNTVNVKKAGRIAFIEMNRPEVLNALNTEMIKGLVVKLKQLSISDDIDIIVLIGNGRDFCAGGDIKIMQTILKENDFFHVMDCINELAVTLYSIPKLTLCAISGAAAGLGLSMALATDYIVADQSSKFAMNFIGIGLIPDGGAHFFLERRLGEVKAKQLIWEGKTMSPEEALQMDIIHQIAEGDLKEAVDQKLADWLSRPVQAMIKTKKILAEKNRPHLLKVLELEKFAQYKMSQTEDHKEGVQAFIEKRRPFFIGK